MVSLMIFLPEKNASVSPSLSNGMLTMHTLRMALFYFKTIPHAKSQSYFISSNCIMLDIF